MTQEIPFENVEMLKHALLTEQDPEVLYTLVSQLTFNQIRLLTKEKKNPVLSSVTGAIHDLHGHTRNIETFLDVMRREKIPFATFTIYNSVKKKNVNNFYVLTAQVPDIQDRLRKAPEIEKLSQGRQVTQIAGEPFGSLPIERTLKDEKLYRTVSKLIRRVSLSQLLETPWEDVIGECPAPIFFCDKNYYYPMADEQAVLLFLRQFERQRYGREKRPTSNRPQN